MINIFAGPGAEMFNGEGSQRLSGRSLANRADAYDRAMSYAQAGSAIGVANTYGKTRRKEAQQAADAAKPSGFDRVLQVASLALPFV